MLNKKTNSKFAEDWTIHTLVAKNPKRKGSDCYKRFNLYQDGMTVGDYLDACEPLGHMSSRYKYRADIRWDEKHKFIEIRPPSE